MMLPIENPDDRGTMRYFTISSSPLDKKYLRVITKVIQSSFKMTLDSLKPGDPVSFFGPNGTFYLYEEEPSHVFLAGGVGMTPFISMIQYAAAKNLQNQLTLLVSFVTPQNFIFFDELSQISKEHQNIHVVYTTERISPELLKKNIPSVTKPLYYITGPPPG
jgi:ferredoxin-NADP reductase